jgi:type IV secretory pathway TrbF-like protein
MRFKRSSVRYSSSPAPETPYQAAQQAWDHRIGAARVQASNWRLMAFGCLLLAMLSASGLLWQLDKSTITPFVIEVDPRGGARPIGPAIEHYRPTDAQIVDYLSRFLQNVRSLSIDPIIVRQNWLAAYDYVTPRGAAFLNEYARARNPFARVGRESVAIETANVVRASSSSFQIRWTERSYLNGTLTSTERWTAILTVALRPPASEDTVRRNPLGIYIDGMDWSRDLTAPVNSGESQ